MSDHGRKLRLRVADASLDDVGEGRARLSHHLMDALDLEEGDFLRIQGTHSILVRVLAGAADDEGLAVVRLDATQRQKAGVQVGSIVEAERYDIPAASLVRVILVGASGAYEPTPDDLRPPLCEQPVMIGDSISIAPRRTEFEAQVNLLGLTVAEVLGSSTECGAIMARIVETVPGGVVQVDDGTELRVETGVSSSDAGGAEAEEDQ